jgi:beta-lactamase superfamily II metal-dependent hydrolase
MKVTVFQTGQGLCVLVSNIGCPLLFDAGSTNVPQDETSKTNIVNRIVNDIVESGAMKLNVILSHPHDDHINWVSSIVDHTSLTSFQVRIFAGGNKEEDEKTYKNHKPEKQVDWAYSEEESAPISFLFEMKDAKAEVKCTRRDQVSNNLNGISVLIRLRDKLGFSVMLGGDANENTFEGFKVQSTLYLITHHGSVTHGSNSVKLMNSIRPRIAVVSAFHKYNHPKVEAMENVIQANSLLQTVQHYITCGIESTKLERFQNTLVEADKKYQTFSTALAIFSCEDSGDITIETKEDNYVHLSTRKDEINVKLLKLGVPREYSDKDEEDKEDEEAEEDDEDEEEAEEDVEEDEEEAEEDDEDEEDEEYLDDEEPVSIHDSSEDDNSVDSCCESNHP